MIRTSTLVVKCKHINSTAMKHTMAKYLHSFPVLATILKSNRVERQRRILRRRPKDQHNIEIAQNGRKYYLSTVFVGFIYYFPYLDVQLKSATIEDICNLDIIHQRSFLDSRFHEWRTGHAIITSNIVVSTFSTCNVFYQCSECVCQPLTTQRLGLLFATP